MLNHCTALRVLSVVYTTEKKQEHTAALIVKKSKE